MSYEFWVIGELTNLILMIGELRGVYWLTQKTTCSTLYTYMQCRPTDRAFQIPYTSDPQIAIYSAVMAQWLGYMTRNHKVASSSPATAMSSFGDWFTQP